MAKTKKTAHCSQPEPNPFLQCTPSTMSEAEAETHVITTSTPASPDEPQPTLSQEESQQPQEEEEAPENVPETTPPVLVIQPQASSQEEDVETAAARRHAFQC